MKKQIEIEARYEDYIRRQAESIERFRELERKILPGGIDYFAIPSLSNELKCKLDAVRPGSIGQAQRIPGMTQAALAAILVHLKKKELEAHGFFSAYPHRRRRGDAGQRRKRRASMRWEDEQRSGNVEDRRGMPVSRGMMGGGIGTVILVLVALYFGIDPSAILQSVPTAGRHR